MQIVCLCHVVLFALQLYSVLPLVIPLDYEKRFSVVLLSEYQFHVTSYFGAEMLQLPYPAFSEASTCSAKSTKSTPCPGLAEQQSAQPILCTAWKGMDASLSVLFHCLTLEQFGCNCLFILLLCYAWFLNNLLLLFILLHICSCHFLLHCHGINFDTRVYTHSSYSAIAFLSHPW